MAKGATVAALVMLLELGGVRCEVDLVQAVMPSRGPGRGKFIHHQTVVRLKEAHHALDVGRLVFALAHPSTLRRFFFSIQEQLPAEELSAAGVTSGGYGTPADVSPEHRGDVYIGHSMLGEPQWGNEQAAMKWIIAELKRQGVTIKGESA